ncbi:DUF7262 family protein [Halobaculum sp. D14]|uniref:DUF7262 family protein n=1 Tax=unclassified Halobaculum TaxID=2640896 RepID=UPI003EBCE637
MPDRDRGQLSLPALEAAVGVALLLAVTAGFGVALPDACTAEAQLDAYAADAATVLAEEPPRHVDASRLAEAGASAAAFDRERDALRHRVERILGDNLMFRVETAYGAVGFERLRRVPIGRAVVPTGSGEVTIEVWFA